MPVSCLMRNGLVIINNNESARWCAATATTNSQVVADLPKGVVCGNKQP